MYYFIIMGDSPSNSDPYLLRLSRKRRRFPVDYLICGSGILSIAGSNSWMASFRTEDEPEFGIDRPACIYICLNRSYALKCLSSGYLLYRSRWLAKDGI